MAEIDHIWRGINQARATWLPYFGTTLFRLPIYLLLMDFFNAQGARDGANDSDDENPFDFRTTNDRFQQRLQEAHKHSTDREIEQDLVFEHDPWVLRYAHCWPLGRSYGRHA